MTEGFLRMIRGAAPDDPAPPPGPDERVPRHSTGLAEFHRLVEGEGRLRILDLGPTSPANIAYLTGQGHKVYQEDILRAATSSRYLLKDKDGKTSLDAERFLSENLQYTATVLDAAFCWDVADYLPEAFVRPAVARLHRALKPRGVLLAFFHTRDAGPQAPHFRYHLVDRENLELQTGPQFRLQRVFQNRHIEKLFKDFSSVKFFLARDHVREVLVVK